MKKGLQIGSWMLVLLVAVGACVQDQSDQPTLETAGLALEVTSSAFKHEGDIPTPYTCDGEDRSPPLSWSEPPQDTRSLALICDDPDAPAGTWDHWVLYNIPAAARSLPEGVQPGATVDGVGTHGTNSWRNLGYGGPCPPPGSEHRYYFKLYALDTALALDVGADKEDVDQAMEGHILAQGQLMGRYAR